MATYLAKRCDSIGCKKDATGGYQVELTGPDATRYRFDFCMDCTLRRFAGSDMEEARASINRSPLELAAQTTRFSLARLPRTERDSPVKYLNPPKDIVIERDLSEYNMPEIEDDVEPEETDTHYFVPDGDGHWDAIPKN